MADYNEAPGATFDYSKLIAGLSGQAANLRVRIFDGPTDATAAGYPVAGVSESGSTALFSRALTAPTTAGEYVITITNVAGTTVYGADSLLVTSSVLAVSAPAGTDLTTVADVKDLMEQATSSTSLDGLIQRHITRASAIIPRRYRRDFAPRGTLTRRVMARGPRVSLQPYDLRTPTSITFDPSGTPQILTADQYGLTPYGTDDALGTYTWLDISNLVQTQTTRGDAFGRNEIEITGVWGPVAVPTDVNYAAALTVASWLSRPIATANALESFQGGGGEVRPDKFGGFALPFAAHQILSEYQRMVLA